ncbi:MAG: potassium-transporting ATPase subunit KdpA [Candidatus Hydrogenedentota bacterium]
MNIFHGLEVFLYFTGLVLLAAPQGILMARLLEPSAHAGTRWEKTLDRCERFFLKVVGVAPNQEMNWREYAIALMSFNILGIIILVLQQMFQAALPLNPAVVADVPFWLAVNTAVSFVTNTNWQAYSGETAMSYLTQMTGLAVQNFLSVATSVAALLVLARGLTRRSTELLGNFWRDLARTTLYILIPLSFLFALILVHEGVVQTFSGPVMATTIEGADQVIPLGPAASQIAIKQLGTNGGGFYGVNSAHPFENPTPLSNFFEMLAILLLPAACVFMFGRLIDRPRHAHALLAAMFILLFAGLGVSLWAEHQPNPALGITEQLEGKETRFSVTESVLWSVTTTAASNGSVNAMHDSFSPWTGLVQIFNMQLGEVVFGGVGCGLYGMVLFVLLTVFLAGLMVGRTPEYLGKKIETREMAWALTGILLPGACVLLGTAASCLVESALAGRANRGPHGLSEILYAFSSAAGNNGSAFAGLAVNTDFYNGWLALTMFLGRFGVLIPVLAIAGSLAAKRISAASSGTFPTEGPTFVVLLVGVIVIVGGLNFFPALLLGPGVEQFLMLAGRLF